MLSFMNDYYKGLKSEVGIDAQQVSVKDDAQLDSIVTHLKPNSTAENFRPFMTVRRQQTQQ